MAGEITVLPKQTVGLIKCPFKSDLFTIVEKLIEAIMIFIQSLQNFTFQFFGDFPPLNFQRNLLSVLFFFTNTMLLELVKLHGFLLSVYHQ